MSSPLLHAGESPRVYEIHDEIDLSCADELEAELIAVAARERGAFVISLEHCAYIDSSGLRALVRFHRIRPDTVLVVPASTQVRRVFEITDLVRSLGIADSVPNALARIDSTE
jgi:anti-anti-sigma factor